MDVAGRGICFARVGDDVVLTLNRSERMLIADMLGILRDALENAEDDGDPAIRRLYPPATMDDDLAAAVYDVIHRGELVEGRRRAIEAVALTLAGGPLTGEQAQAWLTTINDARIMIGVRINVTEDSTTADFDDDDSGLFIVYKFLSKILDELVGALMGEE